MDEIKNWSVGIIGGCWQWLARSIEKMHREEPRVTYWCKVHLYLLGLSGSTEEVAPMVGAFLALTQPEFNPSVVPKMNQN